MFPGAKCLGNVVVVVDIFVVDIQIYELFFICACSQRYLRDGMLLAESLFQFCKLAFSPRSDLLLRFLLCFFFFYLCSTHSFAIAHLFSPSHLAQWHCLSLALLWLSMLFSFVDLGLTTIRPTPTTSFTINLCFYPILFVAYSASSYSLTL